MTKITAFFLVFDTNELKRKFCYMEILVMDYNIFLSIYIVLFTLIFFVVLNNKIISISNKRILVLKTFIGTYFEISR